LTILPRIHSPAMLSYTQPPQSRTGSVGFITSNRTDPKLDLEIPDGNIWQYPAISQYSNCEFGITAGGYWASE